MGDHLHDDSLHLYILGRLKPAEMESFDRHIAECEKCRQRLSTTADFIARRLSTEGSTQNEERRSEPRYATSEITTVRVLSPLTPEPLPATLINISKSGMALLIGKQLLKGTLVQVRIGRTFVLGDVVYFKAIDETTFQVGIRVSDVV